ncbi:MAG: hypothetical protein JWO36_3465 [Myxococcales bacterium]|nr:hypothetical protein [Myxococcales bacterium]
MLVATLGCSSKSERAPQPDPVAKAAPIDAGTGAAKVIKSYDPASGMHLDDDTAPQLAPPPATPHAAHPIDVTLRSTPSGASAIVDGVFVGVTPAFWSGEADGHEHEFTFVKPGYALARYRFVPVSSGVVHARLEPISEDIIDAGTPAELAPGPAANPPIVVPAPAPIAPRPPIVPPAAAPLDAASAEPRPSLGPQP